MRTIEERRLTWSAYTLGVATSTVAGKLKIMGGLVLISFPVNHAFLTASQISTANSGSVWVKVSGEYSNCQFVRSPRLMASSESCRTSSVCRTASSMVLALEAWKTVCRKRGDVALYMWKITFFPSCTASNVLRIRSALAGDSTFTIQNPIIRTSPGNGENEAEAKSETLHLDRYIIWRTFRPFCHLSHKIKIRVTRCWKSHLNLLEATFDQ